MVDRQVEGVFLDEEIFVQRVAAFMAVVQGSNVATGTEGFLAGTAQHDRVDIDIGGPGVQVFLELAHHVEGQGIEAGGAVEGQMTDVIANLGQHFVWRGIHGRSPRG